MSQPKQIGKVARELAVNPKTLRFYEAIKLIPETQRTERGYRLYSQADVDRLAFIIRARELDFSLGDIAAILAFREVGEAPCRHVTRLITKQLKAIEAKMDALNQLKCDLETIQQQSLTISLNVLTKDDCFCPLIEERFFSS